MSLIKLASPLHITKWMESLYPDVDGKVKVQVKAEQLAHLDNLRNRNAVLNKKHNLTRHKRK